MNEAEDSLSAKFGGDRSVAHPPIYVYFRLLVKTGVSLSFHCGGQNPGLAPVP
jgi:hypothetical protein